jgi:hypothetical protein
VCISQHRSSPIRDLPRRRGFRGHPPLVTNIPPTSEGTLNTARGLMDMPPDSRIRAPKEHSEEKTRIQLYSG